MKTTYKPSTCLPALIEQAIVTQPRHLARCSDQWARANHRKQVRAIWPVATESQSGRRRRIGWLICDAEVSRWEGEGVSSRWHFVTDLPQGVEQLADHTTPRSPMLLGRSNLVAIYITEENMLASDPAGLLMFHPHVEI